MKIVQFTGTFDPITLMEIERMNAYHQRGYKIYLNHQFPNDRSKAILKESLKRLSYLLYGESVKRDEEIVVPPCPIDDEVFGKLTYNALKLAQKKAYYYDVVLATKMSRKRYEHSLNVAELAKNLAIKHHLDPSRAYLMGLVHDVTKELDPETEAQWMLSHDARTLSKPQAFYHQYTAIHYLKTKFRIKDQELLSAVENHTSAEANNLYAMILYVADKLEPGRNYDCKALIQQVYKNIYRGFKAVKTAQKDYLSLEGNQND